MPIQPTGIVGIRGKIELDETYVDALRDIDGFSHLIILYYFDKYSVYNPRVKPFMDNEERGLFAVFTVANRFCAVDRFISEFIVDGIERTLETFSLIDLVPAE